MLALRRFQNIGLPLLMKELLEQSARRRTYWIRVAYAGMLFAFCLLFLLGQLPQGTNVFDRLGLGRLIFENLVGWEFGGIYVFLPAIVCGTFAIEKEQNTLGLLFLTRLGPWTIVFEKLFSRLIPMSCLLFCSFPLIAFSYSLGGIETVSLFTGIWLLVVSMFQVAAITLACSAYCRTTSSALLTSYAVIACVSFGLAVVDSVLLRNWIVQQAFALENWGKLTGSASYQSPFCYFILYPCTPFMHFHSLVSGNRPLGQWSALLMGTPSVLCGCLALIFARIFVIRRAFVPPGNLALKLLQRIDGLFQRLNRFAGRGVQVFNDSQSTPGTDPVAWRETHKRALGQLRYLLRVFLLLTIPAVLLSFLFMVRESIELPGFQSSITNVVPNLWLVSTLLIAVSSTCLISGERSRQTLDVLLVAPMKGRQIILEKMAGINRLIWVCTVPLLACVLLEGYWRESLRFLMEHFSAKYSLNMNFYYWEYIAAALTMVWIYPRLTAWLAIWIGLRTKTAARATLITLIVFVALCMLPIILFIVTVEMLMRSHQWARGTGIMMLLQFSPLGLLLQSEFGDLREFYRVPYVPILVNCVWYGTWLCLIRWHVLRSADRLLGRTAAKP